MGKLKILGDVVEGGLGMMRNALKAEDAVKELTAAERAAAGRKGAELIKSQPQVKASEALGQMREKGMKRTTTTQADRTRVGGGNIGGAPFSAISEADPNYAGKVWGVMDEGTAARLKNLTDPETAWTTMLGSANQLKTNPIVFDKLKRGFVDSMKQGNLSDELAGKINHNLELTFGAGADIRDPKIWRQADTFEKRAALADVMMGQGTAPSKGGVAIGGEKSGRGVIFQPTDILKRETEPSLLHIEHGGDVPTFAAGPRLFRLEKESEFRPDLHPGFPTLIKGKDLGVNMRPTPTEIYLPDWHAKFKKDNPERKGPGYYDLALGVKGEGLPSQELTDEYIRHLIREGFKKGGAVEDFDAKVDRLIEKHHFDSHVDKRIEEHFAKGGMPKLARTTLRMGKGGLLGKGAKALVDAVKAAEVVPAAEKVIVQQAPSIIIPSKVSNVKEAIRQSKGDYGARRVERAADEIPNLEKLYKEQALIEAFGGDNAKALMTMKPKDFEKYAAPLDARFMNEHSTRYTTGGERLPYPEYMSEYLPNVGAFNDVPFLVINKQEQGLPLMPFISGHEGRHRNRVMAGKGEESGLVILSPRSELREPFPRKHQDQYINALKEELDMTGNKVVPEKYFDNFEQKDIKRPAIDLPDIYATGGVILKHKTLRNRGATQAQPNGFKEGGKSEATVQATPRSKGYGAASDLLKEVHEFASKPFGYSNPPVEFISELLGIPAASRVLDKLSYGEPITNYGKANVPLIPDDTFDAFTAGLGGLGSMSKLAKPLAKGVKMLPKNLPVGMSIKPVGDIPTGVGSLSKAEREAGLQKFLAPSAEKRRMYHGSKEPNIKEFKTRKEMTDDSMMTGHYADERDAVFLSPEPQFTKHFSQEGYTDTHQAPTTYPVYVQIEKPFDFDNPEHLKKVKETYLDMYHNPESEFYDPHMLASERSTAQHLFNKRVDNLPNDENNWARIENQDFQDVLKDLGFDSFYTRERGTKNLGVYEPNRIKSAIGNRGTYDIRESDINKARGGAILKHHTLRNRRANQRVR